MKISDCMKRDVVSIADTSTIAEAAAVFAARHVGLLPILDGAGRLVGMVQLRDLLARSDEELTAPRKGPWQRVSPEIAMALHELYQQMFATHANYEPRERFDGAPPA